MEKELFDKKIKSILDILDSNEYPETFELIFDYTEGYSSIEQLVDNLHGSDPTKEIEENVRDLLIEFYNDLIENDNNADAMCDLGSLYYTGRCGEQSYEKAVFYYEMAAKNGNRQAQENLGYCYYYGRIGEPDYKKAYHYFVKGALDHHLNSLYKIGDMYKNGYYVEKDEKEAFIIYETCYDEINEKNYDYVAADIFIRLADCFANGTGCVKNLSKALTFYQKAESAYYPRIKHGDFLYMNQYERSIKEQEKIRIKLREEIPGYSWTKKN